jgi:phage repressor protein C with HTH and peptisase S24 domain
VSNFYERLMELKNEGELLTDFAARLGITYQSLHNYQAGREPNRKVLVKIAESTGVDVGRLMTGRGGNDTSTRKAVVPLICDDEYLRVPLIEGQVTAGPDGGILFEQTQKHLPFQISWAEKKFGRGEERLGALVLIRIRGDSMIPTISPGELVLVDTWESERTIIKPEGIYIIRQPEGTVTVKRIVMAWKKINDHHRPQLICISDNNTIKPFSFDLDPDRPLKYYVLGRVRWAGKEFD